MKGDETLSQIATAKKSLRFLCLAAGLALSLVFSDQGASAQDQANKVLFTNVSVCLYVIYIVLQGCYNNFT